MVSYVWHVNDHSEYDGKVYSNYCVRLKKYNLLN